MVKMPQRQRHNTGGGAGGAELPLLDPNGVIEAHNAVATLRCCVPLSGGCLKGDEPISLGTPSGCVRIICNNDHCTSGNMMHEQCFVAWEQHLSLFLKSCGRARSWSEKQRLQNLWTKKGYNLAFRACACLCGRGHLRKDLDWVAPEDVDEYNKVRKKKENRHNLKPVLVTYGPGNPSPMHPAGAHPCVRARNNSISSTGSSPPSDVPPSPIHSTRPAKKKERNRNGSCGLFARRNDFSVFNCLPKNKINGYHIKMEDDGYYGNDETRSFILSTLAAEKTCRTACVLCHQTLLVFHRYPLLDGTFFLTSVQHSRSAISVEVDGRTQYLSAICIGCLEGWNVVLKCSFCHRPWDGSALILGTMYSFDIFAAMPCCRERLQCSRCQSVVLSAEQRLPFFSEFSRALSCPQCRHVDHHFVKSLQTSFYRQDRLAINW